MLEEIYLKRREEIDEIIKKAIQDAESKMIEISNEEIEKNRKLYDALEENYNLKLSTICKEMYLKGFKDGVNLMLEVKEK